MIGQKSDQDPVSLDLEGLIGWMRLGLSVDRDFLDAKHRDHLRLTFYMLIGLGVLAVSLWGWDIAVDAEGAVNTLGLRLMLGGIAIALAVAAAVPGLRRWHAPLFVTLIILGEAVFSVIISKLENGNLYCIGGFMYFIILALLVLQIFSVRITAMYCVLVALVPHLMAMLGYPEDFPHLQYGALLWPAAAMGIIAQMAMSTQYYERYETHRRLQWMASHDSLTSLLNHGAFFHRLKGVLAEGPQTDVNLVILDIDDFKQINDRMGHPVGDALLVRVAEKVRGALRESDLCARIGGDEFALMMPGVSVVDAAARIEAVAVTLAAEASTPAGISAGIAAWRSGESMTDFFARADAGLLMAKQAGKGCVRING